MQFTGEEIICFNSILGGGELEWVELPLAPFGNRGNYIRGTIGQLKEKGIVSEGDRLTALGQLVVGMVDEYKNAKTKLMINNLRIALVDVENVVLIAKVQEGYEIKLEQKKNVLEAILYACPYLKSGQEGKVKREPKYMPYEEWEKGIGDIAGGDSLFISQCREKELTEQRLYYWDGECGYCYQPGSKTRYKKGPEDIRGELLSLLEEPGREDNERVVH